jgi:hypothetical protein
MTKLDRIEVLAIRDCRIAGLPQLVISMAAIWNTSTSMLLEAPAQIET